MERLIVVALGEADGNPVSLTPFGRRQMERIGECLYPLLKGYRVRLTTGDLRWMRDASARIGQVLKIEPDAHRSMRCEGESHLEAVSIMGGLRHSSEPVVVALLPNAHATALMQYAWKSIQGANAWPPTIAQGDAAVLDLRYGSRLEVYGELRPSRSASLAER